VTQATVLLPPIPNDFDPTTTAYSTLASGFTPIVGSIVTTLDGTKGWKKFGAGTYQWRSTSPYSAAFGSSLSTWDTTALIASLKCDTLGPFVLAISGVLETGSSTLTLRINGSAASMLQYGTEWSDYGTAATKKTDSVVAPLGGAGYFYFLLECLQPYSGNFAQVFRMTVSQAYYNAVDSTILVRAAGLPQNQITSVGVQLSAHTMGASSVATLNW
jgi:hypothetical protein